MEESSITLKKNPTHLKHFICSYISNGNILILKTRKRHQNCLILGTERSKNPEHCQIILTVRHILVECNHLAQTRTNIFGRCGVVESFQFHPELVLNFLRDSDFYSEF